MLPLCGDEEIDALHLFRAEGQEKPPTVEVEIAAEPAVEMAVILPMVDGVELPLQHLQRLEVLPAALALEAVEC